MLVCSSEKMRRGRPCVRNGRRLAWNHIPAFPFFVKSNATGWGLGRWIKGRRAQVGSRIVVSMRRLAVVSLVTRVAFAVRRQLPASGHLP